MTEGWALKRLNTIRWTWARYLNSSGESEAALALYDKIFLSRGLSAPSLDVAPILNIEYAQICLALGNRLGAYRCCAAAVDQLRQPTVRNTKTEDVKYLLYCCKYILSTMTTFVDSEAFKLAITIEITYGEIAGSGVSRTARQVINATPQWGAEFDEWFQNQVRVSSE